MLLKTSITQGLLALTLLGGVTATLGCAGPRWATVSDAHHDDVINRKHVKRAVVAAVQAAVDHQAGVTPYEFVLPASATPESYAEIVHRLGSDARVPAGIPAVPLNTLGLAQKRSDAVLESEKINPPVAMPIGHFAIFEVRSVRLRGQTGEIDVVRRQQDRKQLMMVSLDLDPGYGWRVTNVRLWAVDPDAEL
ncbi:MAG: hypothetical protein V3V20_12785 [Algisphaera sp.]